MKIRQAHGLDYAFADDGTFVLILLDSHGLPFATVTMDEAGADDLAGYIDDRLLGFEDTIGEVAGHA